MTEDEMVGWHHQPNGHEFKQAPGDSDGQGSLACCSPWGLKELDMTEQLNKTKKIFKKKIVIIVFWLHWVFIAMHRISLLAVNGSCSSLWWVGFSLWWLL